MIIRPSRFFETVLVVLIVSLYALSQSSASGSDKQSKLAFVIEPVKPVFAKGENIELTFRLSNHSGEKILVAKTFQLAHFVTLSIIDKAGRQIKWCGRIVGQTDFPRSFVPLTSGESISRNLVVSCVNKDDPSRAWGYSLEAAGKYIVAGKYRLPEPEIFFKKLYSDVPAIKGPISAEPITIEIR